MKHYLKRIHGKKIEIWLPDENMSASFFFFGNVVKYECLIEAFTSLTTNVPII